MSQTTTITTANFAAEVLQASQPVLVDFWATWCGPCKMIAPVLDEIAAEQAGRFKIVKVDADTNPALTDAFNIRSIPTLLIFKGGQVISQMTGLTGKAQIIAKLEAAA